MAQNSRKNPIKGSKPFPKGKSGNPGGRPKTRIFAEEVRAFLKERHGNKTRLRQVLETLAKNDPKILLYYGFGKPEETMNVQNPDGSNIIPQAIIDAAAKVAKTL